MQILPAKRLLQSFSWFCTTEEEAAYCIMTQAIALYIAEKEVMDGWATFIFSS